MAKPKDEGCSGSPEGQRDLVAGPSNDLNPHRELNNQTRDIIEELLGPDLDLTSFAISENIQHDFLKDNESSYPMLEGSIGDGGLGRPHQPPLYHHCSHPHPHPYHQFIYTAHHPAGGSNSPDAVMNPESMDLQQNVVYGNKEGSPHAFPVTLQPKQPAATYTNVTGSGRIDTSGSANLSERYVASNGSQPTSLSTVSSGHQIGHPTASIHNVSGGGMTGSSAGDYNTVVTSAAMHHQHQHQYHHHHHQQQQQQQVFNNTATAVVTSYAPAGQPLSGSPGKLGYATTPATGGNAVGTIVYGVAPFSSANSQFQPGSEHRMMQAPAARSASGGSGQMQRVGSGGNGVVVLVDGSINNGGRGSSEEVSPPKTSLELTELGLKLLSESDIKMEDLQQELIQENIPSSGVAVGAPTHINRDSMASFDAPVAAGRAAAAGLHLAQTMGEGGVYNHDGSKVGVTSVIRSQHSVYSIHQQGTNSERIVYQSHRVASPKSFTPVPSSAPANINKQIGSEQKFQFNSLGNLSGQTQARPDNATFSMSPVAAQLPFQFTAPSPVHMTPIYVDQKPPFLPAGSGSANLAVAASSTYPTTVASSRGLVGHQDGAITVSSGSTSSSHEPTLQETPSPTKVTSQASSATRGDASAAGSSGSRPDSRSWKRSGRVTPTGKRSRPQTPSSDLSDLDDGIRDREPHNWSSSGRSSTPVEAKPQIKFEDLEDEEKYIKRKRSTSGGDKGKKDPIKQMLEQLQRVIPHIGDPDVEKVSHAGLLVEGSDYIRSLMSEHNVNKDNAEALRAKMTELNAEIEALQAQLPEHGSESIHKIVSARGKSIPDMFADHVRKRTQEDWRYWVFTSIMGHFVHSFAQDVSNISWRELERTSEEWLQDKMALQQLRKDAFRKLAKLCSKTSIMEDPSKLPDEARGFVALPENEDPNNKEEGGGIIDKKESYSVWTS